MPLAITHPGTAHKDDFLSAAILLAAIDGLVVERREPTANELDDPNIWVFDIGGRYEPELHNFDHHQFDVDADNPRCAFSLLLAYRGDYERAKTAWPWLKGTEILDCHGPSVLAKSMGADPKLFSAFTSPIESFLNAEFARRRSVSLSGARDWLPEMMAEFGGSLVFQIQTFHERLQFLLANGQVLDVGGLGVLVVPDEPRTRRNGFLATTGWQNAVCPDAGILIAPDGRGAGLALERLGDHPCVDFHKVSGLLNVVYAANSGHTAKLDTYDLPRALELCKIAIS